MKTQSFRRSSCRQITGRTTFFAAAGSVLPLVGLSALCHELGHLGALRLAGAGGERFRLTAFQRVSSSAAAVKTREQPKPTVSQIWSAATGSASQLTSRNNALPPSNEAIGIMWKLGKIEVTWGFGCMLLLAVLAGAGRDAPASQRRK